MAGSGFLSGREPDSVRDHPFLRGRFRPAPLIAGARSALSFDLGREAEFDALARRNLDRCARTGIASRAALCCTLKVPRPVRVIRSSSRRACTVTRIRASTALRASIFEILASRAIASTSCVLFMAGDVVCGEARFQPVTKIRKFRRSRKSRLSYRMPYGRSGTKRRRDLAEWKIRATFVSGRMAERSIAAVLKTVEPQGSGGSNPSPSARRADRGFYDFTPAVIALRQG